MDKITISVDGTVIKLECGRFVRTFDAEQLKPIICQNEEDWEHGLDPAQEFASLFLYDLMHVAFGDTDEYKLALKELTTEFQKLRKEK